MPKRCAPSVHGRCDVLPHDTVTAALQFGHLMRARTTTRAASRDRRVAPASESDGGPDSCVRAAVCCTKARFYRALPNPYVTPT